MNHYRRWASLAWTMGFVVVTGCTSSGSLGGLRPDALAIKPLSANEQSARPKELPPDQSAKLCMATAQELDRGGRYQEAVTLYARARQLEPKHNAQVCRRLAVLHDFVGDHRSAQQEYEKALLVWPKDADLHNDYGYSCYCRGSWQEAERHFRDTLALAPKHDRAWVNLGLTLGQQGRYDESVQAFTQVVTQAQAYSNVAFVLLTQGQAERARVFYQLALSHDPQLDLPGRVLAKLDFGKEPVTPLEAPVGVARALPSESSDHPALKDLEDAVQRIIRSRAAGTQETEKAETPVVAPTSAQSGS